MSYGYNVPAVKWKTCNQAKKNEVIQGDTPFESRAPHSASLQTGHSTSQTQKLPLPREVTELARGQAPRDEEQERQACTRRFAAKILCFTPSSGKTRWGEEGSECGLLTRSDLGAESLHLSAPNL